MSAKAKAWFKPVTTRRSHGLAVAKCETWKAVACRKGKCTVKKAVRCLGVCQMQGWGGPRKMLGDCTKTGKRLGTFANKAVVKADGVRGLFGRGLATRLVANGIQASCFSVVWKYLQKRMEAGERR